MTKQEIAKLIAVVRSNYPRHFKDMNTANIDEIIAGWAFTLDGFTYEEASTGLKVFLHSDKDGFPPSPGQIVGCIHSVRNAAVGEMTGAEAWELVEKAMSNFHWWEPEYSYDPLPELIKRIIPSASTLGEIAHMNIADVQIGEKARFIRQYDALKKQEREYKALPQEVRKRLEQGKVRGYITASKEDS